MTSRNRFSGLRDGTTLESHVNLGQTKIVWNIPFSRTKTARRCAGPITLHSKRISLLRMLIFLGIHRRETLSAFMQVLDGVTLANVIRPEKKLARLLGLKPA